MARKVTTVTHIDGTVSKRASVTRTYSHAVEVTTNQREVATNLLAAALRDDDEVARLFTISFPLTTREERKPWGRNGETRVTFYAVAPEGRGDDVYLGADVIRADGTVDETYHTATDFLAELKADVTRYVDSAVRNRAYADMLNEGPELTYTIVRWSSSAVNAEKGSHEWLGRGYAAVKVVEVDA